MANSTSIDTSDINFKIQFLISLLLVAVSTTTLASFGVFSNMVNLAIFISQGLEKNMNLSLFCLAFCDFFSAAFTLAFSLSYAAEGILTDLGVDMYSLTIVFLDWRCFFSDMGTGLILFTSLERCLCVTFPFKFKIFFHITKTRIIIITTGLFLLVNYIPVFVMDTLVWKFDRVRNTKVLLLSDSNMRPVLRKYNDFVFAIGLTGACQTCLFVCAVVMFKSLRKSSQVRKSPVTDTNLHIVKLSALSYKEKRLVKMVFLLALCYLFTGVPTVVVVLLQAIFPVVLESHNLFSYTIGSVAMILGCANTCANIFIYYRHNSSYKVSFLRMIRCGRGEPQQPGGHSPEM